MTRIPRRFPRSDVPSGDGIVQSEHYESPKAERERHKRPAAGLSARHPRRRAPYNMRLRLAITPTKATMRSSRTSPHRPEAPRGEARPQERELEMRSRRRPARPEPRGRPRTKPPVTGIVCSSSGHLRRSAWSDTVAAPAREENNIDLASVWSGGAAWRRTCRVGPARAPRTLPSMLDARVCEQPLVVVLAGRG